MTQENAGIKAFTSGAAITIGQRVQLSSGTVIPATVGVEGIGTARNSCDSGDVCAVYLDNPSRNVIAGGTITAGADCYAANDGEVSATISGRRIGIALQAGTDTNRMEMMLAGVSS